MPWQDVTDQALDRAEFSDLVVYGGGIRLASGTVAGLRLRGIADLRSDCRVTVWHDRSAGILALTILPRNAPYDVGQFVGFRTSFSHHDKSLKFTSTRLASSIRGDGGRSYFNLTSVKVAGCHAVFKLSHQDGAEDIELMARRRQPRIIRRGPLELTEVFG